MTGLHHNLTETASDAAIDTACRVLRLPTMRAQFPDLVARAERERLSYRGFLAELLMAECEDRDRRRSERRIRAAGFPPPEVALRLRLQRQPQRRPGCGQQPRHMRLGQEG